MTITLTREEAHQVLDALDSKYIVNCGAWRVQRDAAIETLRAQIERSEVAREGPVREWARISQPEPEPVAWTVGGLITDFSRDFSAYKTKTYTKPLYTTPPQAEPKPVADKYLMEVECTKCGAKQDGVLTVTAPPQREWQGLTDEEMRAAIQEQNITPLFTYRMIARAIEAKLKEKNSG